MRERDRESERERERVREREKVRESERKRGGESERETCRQILYYACRWICMSTLWNE